MSAVRIGPTFGSADKEKDRADLLKKFEPLSSSQRDEVIRSIPAPQSETLNINDYMCMLSGFHGCAMVHAINVPALDTNWMTAATDYLLPPAGALYVFPRAQDKGTNVTCVQVRYDRTVKTVHNKGEDVKLELYNTDKLVVTFFCANFNQHEPIVWEMSFSEDPDKQPFTMGTVEERRGRFEVGFPHAEQCISCSGARIP